MSGTKTKKCFGDFTPSSDKCDKCEVNIDCFVKVYSSLSCFLEALVHPEGKCKPATTFSGTCNEEVEKCNKVRTFLFMKRTLNCFGDFDQKLDTCLICSDYEKCEIFQTMKGNLEINYGDVKDSFVEQIHEFQTGEEQCFGKYEFEDECLSSCEFLVPCRRESNVIPGIGCAFWKKTAEKNYEEEQPCSLDSSQGTCISLKSCTEWLISIHAENKKIDFKMRLYKGFLSLDQIRQAAEVPNGN